MNETPTTELAAVNVILTNMGEAPIDSLSGDLPLDAEKARGVLSEVSEAVQLKGWFWNTETTTLATDNQGRIRLPLNTLQVSGRDGVYTVRDGLLYEIKANANGYVFEGSKELKIIYFLSFEELPPVARRYIVTRAARVFQARELGNDLLLQHDSMEETEAFTLMQAEENRNSKRNLKNAVGVSLITNRYNIVGGLR